MNLGQVSLLRRLGFIEGLSFLFLLGLAMPLKYVAALGMMELGAQMVSWSGRIHGGLFVAYVVVLLLVGARQKWSLGQMFIGFLAAVFPFGWLIVDGRFRAWDTDAQAAAEGRMP